MTRTLQKQIQLSKAKSDFVANVSHEIRTPLSVISMYNETLLLGRVPSDEKKREYYEIIDKETNRLKNIVNKILSFSQIEANKRSYEFQNCSPDAVIADIINTYSFHLTREQFELTMNLGGDSAQISTDKEAFSEALVNLIDNAVKYSADERSLTISTEVIGTYYVVYVKDQGRGIPEDQLPFIFDQFYRVQSDDNFDAKGTGLGLALVKSIMEVHGGKVEVESELQVGSEFRLYYPLITS
jgi:two-component system phosphate regulon sensor histidine kinase PhoR